MNARRGYRRLFDLRLGGRGSADAEMDLEIESHLAMRTADLVRAGMTPDAARTEAMHRFGDFDTARKRLHTAARQREAAMRQRDTIGSVIADLRFAIRQARKSPGFTLLTVGTLAIGLGATSAMFTLVERVLLRPLPFPHAEQLIAINGLDSARNKVPTVSSADWLDWRRASSLQASALYSFPQRQGIITADSALRVDARRVSGTYFSVLQPHFLVGRPFSEDEVLGGSPVVVISERLWKQVFGGDPTLRTPLRTALRAYTIVGVVARGQEFPENTDLWVPVPLTPQTDRSRVNINWIMIARMRSGVTGQQARAEIATVARGIRAADPSAIYDFDVGVQSLAEAVVGPVSTYLMLLMAVVTVVLLIVCANVAASSLARTAARAREMAIRNSLGAVRRRLIQQLLIEHALLGLIGGAAGLLLGSIATRSIVALWGGQIPRASQVAIDWQIFAFTFAASLAAGVAAGTIPALRVTRVSLSSVLSSGGRTSAKGGRNLAGASLVSAEIALALILLTGAGLLIRSFRSLLGRDIGFDTNVATAEVGLSGPLYATDTARRYAYWESLVETCSAIPGVTAVGLANFIPLGITGQSFIDVEGRQDNNAGAVYRSVSRGFFAALNVPLLIGREFDSQDGPGTERVVVINHAMATKYWPDQNPIGKLVRARSMEPGPNGRPAAWLTIIGVVGDVRTYGLETEPRPEMYVYYRQTPSWTFGMTALIRASVPATQLLGEIRRRAHAVDPRFAVDVGTLEDRLRGTLSTRVLTMSLLSGFAGIALLLAAMGIYGVLSYAVTQRTRELAVRSALGADRIELLRLVLASGLRVVAFGAAFGLVAAFWLTGALSSMLVDVTAIDPLSYVVALGVLLVVSFAAMLVPSVRATRLDPNIALQAE
jgi:putative ABC transport system permease protein